MNSFDVNVWGCQLFGVYVSLAIVIGLLILRYAPGGDGIMSPYIAVRFVSFAYWIQPSEVLVPGCQSLIHPRTFRVYAQVPIALYGFVIAATWIDFIADHLVALLEFLGIVARIPNYIMGLTVSDEFPFEDFRYLFYFFFLLLLVC